MEKALNEQEALGQLEIGYEKAKETLNDMDKIERLLQRAEKKLRSLPKVGDTLAVVPTFISLVRSYILKEYTDVPIGSVIAIVSAITYVVSPMDIIPDWVPVAGYLDDLAVVNVCVKLVKSDVDEYCKWREEKRKAIE